MLGGVLLLAGTLKLGRNSEFEPLSHALGLSPGRLLTAGFRALPAIEVFVGAWLVLGLWTTAALGVTTLLFISFTLVLFVLVRVGYNGGCACFGAADRHRVGFVPVGRNAVLLIASGFVLTQSLTSRCVGSVIWKLPPLVPTIAVLLLIFGLMAYLLAVEVEVLFRHAANRSGPTQEGGSKYG
jgi:uncharacterized membrane protein YphA (DoxX/SURF4 family)